MERFSAETGSMIVAENARKNRKDKDSLYRTQKAKRKNDYIDYKFTEKSVLMKFERSKM